MTVKRFKFVSPGVKINEIDRSVLSNNAGTLGPVVVGKTQRGPGLMPVTVGSYAQFDALFGSPTRGVVNSTINDVWRTGQVQSPTYAAYAAEAWLKNSSPLTTVRVLGVQHPEATAGDALAGWSAGTGEAATQGGAIGLFLAQSGSQEVTGTLAAVIYLATGSVELAGDDLAGTPVQGTNTIVKSIGSNYEVKLVIKDGAGTPKLTSAVNLNKNSNNYIRKVLNTNPVSTNSTITNNLVNYWLGETFETFVTNVVPDGAVGQVLAFVAPLESGSGVSRVNFGDHLGVEAQPAKTGWVIGQDLNTDNTAFVAAAMPKLFRFSTLGGEKGDSSGEWEQNNVMVAIEDIKPSNNIYNKFGSFTVKVRTLASSPSQTADLEVFSNCNLDPTSPNYVAKLIGDKVITWDETDSRHRVLGNFSNRSSFIRIEMDESLEQGALDPSMLPFGFFGPAKFKDATVLEGQVVTGALISGAVDAAGTALTCSILFPSIPMTVSASDGLNNTHLGLDPYVGNLFNEGIPDLLRAKPANVDSYETDHVLLTSSVVFTLDDVSASADVPETAVWVDGARVAGSSLTAISASSAGYKAVLEAGFNKFTMPLFGGTDGFRITEKDPLRNSFMTGADRFGKSNYAVYSLRRALDTVADPEVLDMNLLVVPGVTEEVVTDRAIEICENRADALAIIDVAGGYKPEAESKDKEKDRLGSVKETINVIKARQFNTSYGCTYYPWVKVTDRRENGDLWMPPSVVALGTMASSQEVSAVWFAPAGFNRGGLDRGSSGLTVTEVREVLKATQRDDLYEVNINPIARFPAEGIVIFGQKTLQATPSALDRINVRRLVLFLKKQVSRIASGLLFDQNIKTTWQRFNNQVKPLMDSVKAGGGLSDYKVVLDETTTTPDLVDRNTMYAKIFIKPAYAIEFIAIDFVITNSGASFNDL
jgi:hypothetical protein